MAEFCLDCWNELNHIHLTEEDVILSKHLDLCEGCEKMRPVVEADYLSALKRAPRPPPPRGPPRTCRKKRFSMRAIFRF